MPRRISNVSLIEFNEIRKLLREKCVIRLGKSGIYYYMKKHAFPLPVGLARPRKWERKAVLDWVRKQKN